MAARGKEVLVSRITALLATVALSALGLAGCGSEDVPEALSPQAAVAEAATKTADAGSARVTFTGTVSGVPGGPFTISGEGEYYTRQQGRVTLTCPSSAPLPEGRSAARWRWSWTDRSST